VAGIYTMANCSGHQVMVKEDFWGLTSITYTEGRWQIIRQAKKGDRMAVEESYSSPPTYAACPEMSPGLEGGYIALGNKVEIACASPFSLPALLGISIAIGLLILALFLCCCCFLRQKRRRKKLRLISRQLDISDDSDSESFL